MLFKSYIKVKFGWSQCILMHEENVAFQLLEIYLDLSPFFKCELWMQQNVLTHSDSIVN